MFSLYCYFRQLQNTKANIGLRYRKRQRVILVKKSKNNANLRLAPSLFIWVGDDSLSSKNLGECPTLMYANIIN